MEEEVLDYTNEMLEGQQIWTRSLISTPGDTSDSRRTYHLVSHLLEEEIVAIIGELEQALFYHDTRVHAWSREGVTRSINISSKVLQCKVGTLHVKHDGIYFIYPYTLIERIGK